MRQGHYVILFAILLGCCLLKVRAEQYSYDSMAKEKEQIEAAVQQAMKGAAECAAKEYSVSGDTINELVKQTFFETLYAALGASGNLEKMQQVELCIPILAVLLNEGAYFNYLEEEATEDGTLSVRRMRSEQYFYVYESEAFSFRFFLDDCLYITNKEENRWISTSYKEAVSGINEWEEVLSDSLFSSKEAYALRKREAIAAAVTAAFQKFSSVYSRIAGQYGAAYSYTVPDFLQKYQIATENVSVLAVVQGWPIATSGMEFYESCVEAGAYIKQTELYWMERPVSLEQPYAVFHRDGCEYFGSFGEENGQAGLEEAIGKYGAFGCPYCISEMEAILLPRIKSQN